jgi:hypothetical protein
VAIDQRDGVLRRYLPITPALCLSVKYDRNQLPEFDPKVPPHRGIEWIDADAELAKSINTLTAKCAEDLVFATVASAGIRRLVQNNARFGIDCDLVTIPSASTAEYQIAAVCIRDRGPPPIQ